MKNFGLISLANLVTLLLAGTSLIVMNTVNVTKNGIKLSQVGDNTDVTIFMPLVLLGCLCLANLVTCHILKHFLDKRVCSLLCLLFSLGVLGISGYLIANVEKLDKIPVVYNKDTISASKALFYVTGAFGLLTGIITVISCSGKLMNKSK
jgi:hypothetical protein